MEARNHKSEQNTTKLVMNGLHLRTRTWLALIFNDVITLICVKNPLTTAYSFKLTYAFVLVYCVHLFLVQPMICLSFYTLLFFCLFEKCHSLLTCASEHSIPVCDFRFVGFRLSTVLHFPFMAFWVYAFCLRPHIMICYMFSLNCLKKHFTKLSLTRCNSSC